LTRDLDKVVTGSCSTQLILSQPTPWVVKLILLINLFFMKETSVKLVFWVLLDIALGIFIIGATFGVGAILRASNAVAPSRTITVSGEGKISVAPDLATAGFSVVTQGTDPAAIQKENSEKINKTVAFLKSKGIEVRSSGLSPNQKLPDQTITAINNTAPRSTKLIKKSHVARGSRFFMRLIISKISTITMRTSGRC